MPDLAPPVGHPSASAPEPAMSANGWIFTLTVLVTAAIFCTTCAFAAVSILTDIRHALVTLVERQRGWP